MNNLITLYQEHLNLQSATFSRIDHEDAMAAVVYEMGLCLARIHLNRQAGFGDLRARKGLISLFRLRESSRD